MYRLDCPVIFTYNCLSFTFSPRTRGPQRACWSGRRKGSVGAIQKGCWSSCEESDLQARAVVTLSLEVRKSQLKLFRELGNRSRQERGSAREWREECGEGSETSSLWLQSRDLGLIPALWHGAESQVALGWASSTLKGIRCVSHRTVKDSARFCLPCTRGAVESNTLVSSSDELTDGLP